jgi:hypothetical protein
MNRTHVSMLPRVAHMLAFAAIAAAPHSAVGAASQAHIQTAAAPPKQGDAVAFVCPVTVVDGGKGGAYRDEALEIILPPESTFVFAPGGPGFVAVSDGALGIKVGWERLRRGRLTIEGRRLDRAADPARASIPDGYGDFGFQPMYLIFPTPGCWQITGRVGAASLTVVVAVEKLGDGPSWRLDL